MLARLERLLAPDEAQEFVRALENAPFSDGRLTAHGAAKARKNNLQLDPAHPVARQLGERLGAHLEASDAFHLMAWPSRMQPLRFCRYDEGMEYGEHADLPFLGPRGRGVMRTDISITIFLSRAAAYDGGELVFASEYGQQTVKGDAGDAVLYPSGTLHRVTKVTRGQRFVAISWIQSRIRNAADRALLYDLQRSIAGLEREAFSDARSEDDLLRLRNCMHQLTRRWLE